MIKLAFLHYHLKTGGVTTVIRQQAEALWKDCRMLALSGEAEAGFPVETITVPGIAYSQKGGDRYTPEETAASIVGAIRSRWPDGCDILHVHNPTLAKNKNLISVLKILQERGLHLFLQIHDFAEDGRPAAFFPDDYPSDCHYGVINSRDYQILLDSGLAADGLHKIPNTVGVLPVKSGKLIAEPFVLYPVRAIRRKNIGEALLISLFLPKGTVLAVTLPPNSPVDMQSYRSWRRFAERHDMQVLFEASSRHPFPHLVAAAKFLITTSITEGFGFSFLEPWTARKMLWGRKLPDICLDFEDNGVDLGALYERLAVPVEWAGRDELFEQLRQCALHNSRQFGAPLSDWEADDLAGQTIEGGLVDFGMLDERFQTRVMHKIMANGECRERMLAINPHLSNLDICDESRLVVKNCEAVLSHYNIEKYRNRLLSIYEKVRERDVRHRIDKRNLFRQFLSPERLHLLKWSPYREEELASANQ